VDRGRICLLGRNSSGKSSLLARWRRSGADAGIIDRQQGLRTGLPQDVPQELQGSVFEVVAGLGPQRRSAVHTLSRLETSGDQSLLPELLGAAPSTPPAWPLQRRIDRCTRLSWADAPPPASPAA
jgi:ATPase subunit of ABC transporter with duplicated ATPase domains